MKRTEIIQSKLNQEREGKKQMHGLKVLFVETVMFLKIQESQLLFLDR